MKKSAEMKLESMTTEEMCDKIANYITYDTSTDKQQYEEIKSLIDRVILGVDDVEDYGYEFLFEEE
tara:strand:- start:296 stop:493 length:198 start_codon:yes stop_codon:yes gene_type:complete